MGIQQDGPRHLLTIYVIFKLLNLFFYISLLITFVFCEFVCIILPFAELKILPQLLLHWKQHLKPKKTHHSGMSGKLYPGYVLSYICLASLSPYISFSYRVHYPMNNQLTYGSCHHKQSRNVDLGARSSLQLPRCLPLQTTHSMSRWYRKRTSYHNLLQFLLSAASLFHYKVPSCTQCKSMDNRFPHAYFSHIKNTCCCCCYYCFHLIPYLNCSTIPVFPLPQVAYTCVSDFQI